MITVAEALQWTRALHEFPDYPVNDLPAMPEGFSDTSWHNDVCPHMSRGDLHIWADYFDAWEREISTAPRYMITRESEEMGFARIELATDEWAEVLAFLQYAPA